MSVHPAVTLQPPAGHAVATLARAASAGHHAVVLADTPVLPPKGLNTSVYLNINRFSQQTAWAHGVMAAYALWLGPVLLVAVFAAAYGAAWWRSATRAAALLGLGGAGTLLALGLNQVIGHAAQELRPYATHPQALVLVSRTTDFSFPSDHSVLAGGLTASVLLVLGRALWERRGRLAGDPAERMTRWRAIRVLAAVNVVVGLFLCFARVYVGAHYPGDVVAGYLLASVVVLATSLLRPLAFRVADRIEPTALGIVLRRPAPALAGVQAAPNLPVRPTGEGAEARSAPLSRD